MEALGLAVKLLEKVSVLIAAVLLLVMIRPAGVWLGESGERASIRRRLFLIAVLGGLAIWGSFLGLDVSGFRFNVRMVGIIVSGILGGWVVGAVVGLVAGITYALASGSALALYAIAASILVGILSGLWSRRFGTHLLATAVGALFIQVAYHFVIGGVMAIVNFDLASAQASNLLLHSAKIAVNVVGAVSFMGILNFVSELERARVSAKMSEAAARSAKLEALQYQVKPHFLFNILNTLSYLIRTQPDRARTLTLDLSEFLRYTLTNETDKITLVDELAQIRKYVDLERARFGDGLGFCVEVESETSLEALRVPPLLLQPLVENSIRYGTVDGKVEVKIIARKIANEHFIIEIVDNGPGIAKDARENGVGLKNVKERLDRFFSGRATFSIKKIEEGTMATIEIFPMSQTKLLDEARKKLEQVV